MDTIHFSPLVEPTPEVADTINRWENDPNLIPYIRPNRNKADLENRHVVTPELLAERLQSTKIYLIYHGAQLIGEMNFQVDPAQLFKKEPGTAWISITIGEPRERGKGIGCQSLRYLEQQIVAHQLKRIELGVFEFNLPAIALYQKLGYERIGEIADFTYWHGRMWRDIRMEKYPGSSPGR